MVDGMNRREMKYGFVILHYKTIDETRVCVESILSLDGVKNIAVIIVDNSYICSGTGKQLQQEYIHNKNVHYVNNTKNCFFSHGNNIGYAYEKQLNCDFIVVANSDTLFLQHDFCFKISKSMKKNKFHVCGPNIVEPMSGSGTSPIAWQSMNEKETKNSIIDLQKKIDLFEMGGQS